MCNSRRFLATALLLGLFTPWLQASEARVYAGLAAFGEESGERFGGEAWYHHISPHYWGIRTGLSYYEVDINDTDTASADGFRGLSVAAMAHLNLTVSPYIGAGIFVGEREDCNKTQGINNGNGNDQDCFNDYGAALYPEVGLQFELARLYLNIFARRMVDSENDFEAFTVYGAGIAFGF